MKRPFRRLAVYCAMILVPALVLVVYVSLTATPEVTDGVFTDPSKVPAASKPISFETNDIDKLQERYDQAKRSQPSDADLVAQLGLLLADARRGAGAIEQACSLYAEVAKVTPKHDHWRFLEASSKAKGLDSVTVTHTTAFRKLADAQRRWEAGRFQEAHALAIQAHDAFLNDPNRSADLGEASLRLGMISLEHSDHYAQAEGRLKSAEQLLQNAWGASHPILAECYFGLAQIMDNRGDFAGAEKLYLRSLEILRQARGENNREYARVLNRYGRMSVIWSKDFASGKCDRALQIRRQILGEDHCDTAESLEDLGFAALAAPDFSKAVSLFRKALAIREKVQGKEHPATAESASGLAIALDAQGQVAEAQGLHRRALRLSEKWRGKDHPLVGSYLINLSKGLLNRDTENGRMDHFLQRAFQIAERFGHTRHPHHPEAVGLLAFYRLIDLSLRYPPGAVSFDPVDRLFQKAQHIYEAIPGGTALTNYVWVLSNRGFCAYHDEFRTHSREVVKQWFDKAWECIEQNGGRTHPEYSMFWECKGRVAVGSGEYELAQECFDKGTDFVRRNFGTSYPRALSDCLYAQAGKYLHQGATAASASVLREIFELRRSEFDRNAHSQCDAERIHLVVDMHMSLSAYLSAFSLHGLPGDCYEDVLRVRGASAAFLVEDRITHDIPEAREILTKLRRARRELAEFAFNPPAEKDRALWNEKLAQLENNKSDLEVDLALVARGRIQPIAPLRTEDVQAALPIGTALVDFFHYDHYRGPENHLGRLRRERSLCAFVVAHEGKPQFVPLGSSKVIETRIQEWRKSMMEGGDLAKTAASGLSEIIWQPIQQHLGSAKTILISPDGPACYVSFAALPGSKPNSYLLEDYTIGYVPSGRSVVELGNPKKQNAEDGLLAVGGIQYGGDAVAKRGLIRGMVTANSPWHNLPCSRIEVDDVASRYARLHPKSRLTRLLADDADVPGFTQALQQRHRYLHFAGHGFFADGSTDTSFSANPTDPNAAKYSMTPSEQHLFGRNQLLLSGLVFARSLGDSSGGVLTAEDVAGFDLRGTEMVVLSACETGLGRSAGGEGVLGLQRAFLGAGAASIVTSLWKVDDAATSLLMDEFYSNLWDKKLSKWEALRQAQLTVLKNPQRIREREIDLKSRGLQAGKTIDLPEADSLRTPPALWAAFVLSGDGR